MSNAFVGTKARAFKQSPCRQRVTRQAGFFDWQVLNGGRSMVEGQGYGPIGSTSGLYDISSGPPFPGPYIPWLDFTAGDPRASTFLVPSASQLKNDGYLNELWFSLVFNMTPNPHQTLGFPTTTLQRVAPLLGADHPRIHKSTSPLGIFNSESIASGFPVRRGVMVISQGFTYSAVTFDSGLFYPAGIAHDQWQQLKLYDKIGGTLTKHTIQDVPFHFMMPHFSGTLPNPHHIEEYFPAIGDPARVFTTDEFTYGNYLLHPNFPYQKDVTFGTIEILIFWFYLHQDDLPSFPFAFNTAKDFFFTPSP